MSTEQAILVKFIKLYSKRNEFTKSASFFDYNISELNSHVLECMKEYRSPGDFNIIVSYIERFQSAVLNIKEGHMVTAKEKLFGGRQLKDLTDENFPFVIPFVLTAKAYYFYRNNFNKRALRLIKEVITYENMLETEGFKIIHFHKIEQIRNVANIYLRDQDKIAGALRLYNVLLKYLVANVPSKKYKLDSDLMTDYPEYRHGLKIALFLESVKTIAKLRNSGYSDRMAYSSVFNKVINFIPQTPEEVVIKEWLNIKDCYYNNEFDRFFISLEAFLCTEKQANFDILKYNLIQDLHSLSFRLGDIAHHKITTCLRNYIATMLNLRMKDEPLSELNN